jgi:hypothetical protein
MLAASSLARKTTAAGAVGIMLATGDVSYLEAALDEGIAALRTQATGYST